MFRWLIFLYLALFPFGQLTRIPIQLNEFVEVNVYLTDLVVGIGAALWVIRSLRTKIRISPPAAKEIFAFMVIASFSLIVNTPLFSSREVLVGSFYLLRFASYALWFFLCWEALKDRKFKNTVFQSLILVGVAVGFFGWFQYFVYPDFRAFSEFGWDEHLNRLAGSFLDPNFTSIILVLTLILALTKFLKQKSLLGWGILAFLFMALAFTYSRSGYLALIGATAVLAWQFRRPVIFMGTLLLLLLTVFLLPKPFGEGVKLERTSTIEARLGNWRQTLQIAAKSPLFGVGFNTLRYVRAKEGLLVEQTGAPSHAAAGSDSSLLFVLATTGIVGFLSYLALGIRLAQEVKFALPALFAIFIHSFFLNSLFYPWVLGWLAILLSLQRDFKG